MLIENLLRRKGSFTLAKHSEALNQIQKNNFPTKDSNLIWELLHNTLNLLIPKGHANVVDPVSYFSDIKVLHTYISELQLSSREYISWPIVWQCNELRKKYFSSTGAVIFYTHNSEYNYSVGQFSRWLGEELRTLTSVERSEIEGKNIWCLRLPDAELNNFTMYGNISHEFGHVYYNGKIAAISKVWDDVVGPVSKVIDDEIEKSGGNFHIHKNRNLNIMQSIKEEVFCDVFAAKLFGPLFFFSFFELFYGNDRNFWSITKTGHAAYPSPDFRLHYLAKLVDINSLMTNLLPVFKSEDPEWERIYSELNSLYQPCFLPTSHDGDVFLDVDSGSVLKRIFNNNKRALKTAILQYVENLYSSDILKEIECEMRPELWSGLVKRLAFGITPNGVLKDSADFYEEAAGFLDVIICSHLYKIVVSSHNKFSEEEAVEEFGKITRLTEKALESIIVHQRYGSLCPAEVR